MIHHVIAMIADGTFTLYWMANYQAIIKPKIKNIYRPIEARAK